MRSSSFLIALFAKTRSKIAKIGKNIPIPFSETEISPDIISDGYINNPNKKRFIKISIRPITNCNFLLLKIKIFTIAKIDEIKNIIGINCKEIDLFENKSNTNIFSPFEIQRLKIKINPPEAIEDSNK